MMLRQKQGEIDMENVLPAKIRKRGCSSSASSSSSIIQNYRFKRAIVVGSRRGGSSTPVPTWKLMMRSPSTASKLRATQSPKYAGSQGGSGLKVQGHGQGQGQAPPTPPPPQQPVSARKLAATLWEMNELPSPRINGRKERRERGGARSVHSGSLPPHLSDPSHSPVSERMDRPGTGSRRRRESSVSQKPGHVDHNVGMLDSTSNASFMEIESRSHAQTPKGSTVGVKTRLKDVSNALTTSKELLKIINRMWGHEDRPSSSMSLISALHAELERARLQVNQLIREQRSDQHDIDYLMKCFAQEKAAWKNKEQKVVEAAIESIAGELEVERKLRRRFESLNKKLGKELAETKASLLKSVKELENEKRERVVIEQVCHELARDIGEDESAKVHEEVEKEREMTQLADVDKLRNQLEAFLGTKRVKEKGRRSLNEPKSEEIAAYLDRARFGSHPSEENNDDGEVVECEEDSAESDLHSIELNTDNNNNKNYKWAYAPGAARDSRDPLIREPDIITGRKSATGRLQRRSTSLQRSISDGVDWGMQNEKPRNLDDYLVGDEMHGYKAVKGLREHLLSGSRAGRAYASSRRGSVDLGNVAQERPPLVPGSVSKSRMAESRGEANNATRKSRS